ncbi:MAG TPA: TCR/Tet family MFS transporter [Nevskiaceae bacterium]|nr:TCR/Tet family MFS transporter [Nevskiaceae bacterium]
MTRRAFTFIFITVLVDSIGYGIVLPVFPSLISALTGKSIAAASIDGGWLAFAFAATQFFCAPVLGNLSDRFGRRVVLLGSLFCFGIDYLIMGFAPTLGWLFVGRVIAGAAGATFSPAYAYVADISAPEKRAGNFGLMGAAFGMGFILGPAIGGALGMLGPRAPFVAAGVLALANFTFGYFALPESLPLSSRRAFQWKRANPLGTLIQIRKYPVVFGLAGAVFLWQLAHQALPTTWSFYTMVKFGWSSAMVGASLAVVGVIMALSQGFLTSRIVNRFGELKAAVIGLVFAALCYSGYALASETWQMFAWMLPWALVGAAYPSLNAMMSQQVPATAQGELQGGVASLMSLSSIIGPPLMTGLLGYFSMPQAPVHFPGAPFLCAALLTFGSLVLCLRAAPRAESIDAASEAAR